MFVCVMRETQRRDKCVEKFQNNSQEIVNIGYIWKGTGIGNKGSNESLDLFVLF